METSQDRDATAARAALDALDADGARLAERVVTPWWYHPVLAVIVAVMVGSQAMPGIGGPSLLAAAIFALPLLVLASARQSGVATTRPVGPRTRRLLFVLVSIVILGLGSAVVIKLTESSPWWGLLAAAVAALATLLLGRRYDEALRVELADSASSPR